MDLVFILDSSGSVSYSDFALMRAFAADVVDVMDVGPNAVRVADIVFSTDVLVEFDFQNYTSKASIRAHLNATRKCKICILIVIHMTYIYFHFFNIKGKLMY